MKHILGAALALSLFCGASVLIAGGDIEAGEAVYKKRCVTCHGPDGSGNPKMAKMLKVELAVNTDSVAAMSDVDIRKLLAAGRGKKKPVKGLGEDDVASIIAYLRTLKK